MPRVSQGHGDSLEWDRNGGGWWANFFCPRHNHSVTINGISASAGPGQTASLSGIKNKFLGGNDIHHNCY